MESEGDVRMFIEQAIVLACWPIVLAMVEKDSRQFDMAIRPEKTQPQSRTRPDLSIFKLQRSPLAVTDSLNPELELLLTSAVEYKGPGVLGNIISSGELAAGVDNGDWDTDRGYLFIYFSHALSPRDMWQKQRKHKEKARCRPSAGQLQQKRSFALRGRCAQVSGAGVPPLQ